MNNKLQEAAREELKKGLAQCTERECLMFKRMHGHGDLEASISDIVDAMDEDRLDGVMIQVQRTLDRKA